MVLKCQKWQLLLRNQLVLLHFLCYFFGLFTFIVTANQTSLNNRANQMAEIKTKLMKIIQKGNLLTNLFALIIKK